MSQSDVPPNTAISKAVTASLRQVLKPLARLMIRHGITLPAVTELLKQVLVDVADTQLPVKGKKTTDSRISVLTGVHRKDVKRLRENADSSKETPNRLGLSAQLVNTWISDSEWLDPKGSPLPLPRQSNDQQRGFDELAESISNDVRPRAILDELQRSGVVTINEEGLIELATHAYIPSKAEEEKLVYFKQSTYGHLMAGVENLESGSPAHFDRIIHYRRVPLSAIDDLRTALDEKGMELLREINTKARSYRDEKAEDPQSIYVGMYLFHEADESPSEEAPR